MKLKLPNLLIFIFISCKCLGQQAPIVLQGRIISNQTAVNDVHVINLKNFHGTISNENGEFEITVSLNDTLFFSSIEFEHKKIRITKDDMTTGKIVISLNSEVTNLNEVFIKGLTGNLMFDTKNMAKSNIPEHNLSFNESDLTKNLSEDMRGPQKAPYTGLFPPAAGSVGIPNFAYLKEQRLKRELSKKIKFPNKIKRELGIKFFTEELKIPEDRIDHFIAYCEFKDLINKYYAHKLLEVIRIFKEESVGYHIIID